MYVRTFRNTLFHLHIPPMKMGQTVSSETSVDKFQTLGNHPEGKNTTKLFSSSLLQREMTFRQEVLFIYQSKVSENNIYMIPFRYRYTIYLLTAIVLSPGGSNTVHNFEVRHPRCVSNKSKCNVYTMCRQTQLSTRWYGNLLNVNLNYMFRPQSLAIIRL